MEEGSTSAVIEHHELEAFAGVEPKFDLHPNHNRGSFLSTISMTSCVISYSPSAKFLLYVLLLLTCIPLIVCGAFTSIFIEDGNYSAAVVSFFAACLSVGTASLFVTHLLSKLEKVHDTGTLEGLKILGMIMSVSSGISLGVFTILAFFKKQAFELHGENYFSSAVFGGICLVVSIQLYLTAQWYQNALKEKERLAQLDNPQTSRSAVIN
ncbi:uncharacterized protein [Parasteatoda tepidariorum]|uniref:uncharacterized protein n=1 Tax=Parasteatoda tepidariorum TaxID=114398 RepID=UPI0039BD7041